MLRKGYMKIKCSECHTEHSYEGRDMIFDKTGSKNRSGITEYIWTSVVSFYCKCDTKIKVTAEITEFPEGTLEDIKYDVKNGILLSKPDISFLKL